MIPGITDDLLPISRAIEELEPAVTAFAAATGLLGPMREFTAWATDLIRYRRAPHQAKILMRAAEKIAASGLPATAVEDKLLRAILEDGPMEEDATMQERWANLLANASTSDEVRAAFPAILRELEPLDAEMLDRAAKFFERGGPTLMIPAESEALIAFGNLSRLGLVQNLTSSHVTGRTMTGAKRKTQVLLTPLGMAFVQACREPK